MVKCSRRHFTLAVSSLGLASLGAAPVVSRSVSAQPTGPGVELEPYPSDWLPDGVRSRFVSNVNGLRVHVLEAGYETPNRPALLLLHGFPELAYSWRHVMVPLAEAGYHVFAPDVRGYGRTTGWSADYDTDLSPFRRLNKVRDALGLVLAFGYRSVAAVIGRDAGSPLAAWCGITRPDICPAVLARVAQVYRQLQEAGEADQVQPVFITFDPERDTAAHLKEYLPWFKADIIGLTGSVAEIEAVAEQYGVVFLKTDGQDEAYDFTHSDYIYLLDRQGRVRKLYPADFDIDEVVNDVQSLL